MTPSCQEPSVTSCRQEIKEPSAFQSLSLGTGEGQGQGEKDREREAVSFAMEGCPLSTSLALAGAGLPARSTDGHPAEAA